MPDRPSRLSVGRTALASAISLLLTISASAAAQEPLPDEELAAQLQVVVEQLPAPVGATDGEQLLSVMGPPDAFDITFEPADDGSITRREEWTYYELAAVFDLRDGQLLGDLPLAEVPTVLVGGPPYDPASFTAGASWESLTDLLLAPETFESVSLEDDYGLPVTVLVGDSILLMFDETGGLFYVETFPLALDPDA